MRALQHRLDGRHNDDCAAAHKPFLVAAAMPRAQGQMPDLKQRRRDGMDDEILRENQRVEIRRLERDAALFVGRSRMPT